MVLPTLVALDVRIWLAPERDRWSISHAAWDGKTGDTLALHVGEQRRNAKRHIIERAVQFRYRELHNMWGKERDPFP